MTQFAGRATFPAAFTDARGNGRGGLSITVYHRPTYTDGVSNGTALLTSETAEFESSNEGLAITGEDIAPSTTIEEYLSPTSVLLSQPATGSGTGRSFQVIGRQRAEDLATVYTDRTKGVADANPFVADSAGNAWPYLDPGDYDAVTVHGITPFTVVRDPAEPVAESDLAFAIATQGELDAEAATRSAAVAALTAADAAEASARAAADQDMVSLTADQDIGGVKTGLDDWFFRRGRPFLSAGAFRSDGVDPTGATDSGPGLRVAVAEACAANLPLYFDPGTYLIASLVQDPTPTTTPADNIGMLLTRGIRLFAQPGTATIKVASSVLAWRTIIGRDANLAVDMSGLDIDGLTFDAQSQLNSPLTYAASDPVLAAGIAGQTRYMISAYMGQRIRVRNCSFVNQCGRNVIAIVSLTGANLLEDVEVDHCLFHNVGVGYWHDHATVYLDGYRPRLHHCTFIGQEHSDGAWTSAWSPFEIHGQGAQAHHIRVRNYAGSGLLVSSRTGDIGGKPLNHVAHHITGYNMGSGTSINLQQSGSDFTVSDSEFTIAPDQWPIAAATPDGSGHYPAGAYPGLPWRSGMVIGAGAVSFTRVRYRHNTVRWLPAVGPLNGSENLVHWDRPNRAPVTDTDVSITDNLVVNCPASVVRVEQLLKLDNWEVSRNTVRNMGVGAAGVLSRRALVSVGRQVWTGTRPTGLADLRVADNVVRDDQVTSTSASMLHIDQPVSRVVSASTVNATNVLTMAGTVHDLGSLVAHANLPGGTLLSGVSVYAPDTFNVTAFLTSNPANATGTADATITTQPPTTDGVEITGSKSSIADAKPLVLAQIPVGTRVFVQGRAPFLPVMGGGNASAGSRILDRPTGIERTQRLAPGGNTWALPDHLSPLLLTTPPAAWYDASALAVDEGATVSSWTDMSGNGRHAALAAGAPTMQRAVLNGASVVRFPGTAALKTAGFTLNQPVTVCLVKKHRVLTGTQGLIDGNSLNSMVVQKTSGHLTSMYAGTFVNGPTAPLTWELVIATFNNTSSVIRVNGGAGTSGNAGSAGGGGVTIGWNATMSAGTGFDGDIAEVVIVAAVSSLGDLNRLIAYFNLKYAQTWPNAS